MQALKAKLPAFQKKYVSITNRLCELEREKYLMKRFRQYQDKDEGFQAMDRALENAPV